MGVFKDLSGNRYERLLVLQLSEQKYISPKGQVHTLYDCVCDCGEKVTVRQSGLVSGRTKSCGCFCRDASAQRQRRHGMKGTPEYIAWVSMKSRCLTPSATGYKHYGGRGIKVCDRWLHNFDNFYEDMGPRPKGMSLDRIDPEGDYNPSNCRWANKETQARNKRDSLIVSFHGEEKPLADWAEQLGVEYMLLYKRIFTRGWSVEKAFAIKK